MSRRRLTLRCKLCGCAWTLTEDEVFERGWRCTDRARLFPDDDALCGGQLVSRGEYREHERQQRKQQPQQPRKARRGAR